MSNTRLLLQCITKKEQRVRVWRRQTPESKQQMDRTWKLKLLQENSMAGRRKTLYSKEEAFMAVGCFHLDYSGGYSNLDVPHRNFNSLLLIATVIMKYKTLANEHPRPSHMISHCVKVIRDHPV